MKCMKCQEEAAAAMTCRRCVVQLEEQRAAANKEIERLNRWPDYFAWEREMEKCQEQLAAKEKEIRWLKGCVGATAHEYALVCPEECGGVLKAVELVGAGKCNECGRLWELVLSNP